MINKNKVILSMTITYLARNFVDQFVVNLHEQLWYLYSLTAFAFTVRRLIPP